MITYEALRNRTYDEAYVWYRSGVISQDQWERYVHDWRTSAVRFSNLGAGLCNYCGEVHR